MLDAYGWVIVQSSRTKYEGVLDEHIDALDDETRKADEQLWDRFEHFLSGLSQRSPLLKAQFTRYFNNTSGHLSVLCSRNHSAPELFELLGWITSNAAGSYGVVYIRNDESTFPNEFRIIRIAKGQQTEHVDPLLSPIYPTVECEAY